jgi:DNA polymerase III sliding clamp (beta) subunit (PCNA family)
MKFVISVEKIKPIIKNYSRFVDEAKIKVNSDGIESFGFSKDMVSAFYFKIPKTQFISFEFEKDFEFGMNIDFLYDIIERFKSGFLTLIIDKNSLVLSCDNRKFTIPFIEISSDDINIDELKNFTCSFSMNGEEFKKIIEDLKVANSYKIKIICDKTVSFVCDGDIIKTEVNTEISAGNQASSFYPIEKLSKIDFSENLQFQFAKDYPIKITFSNGFLIIAPTIEENIYEEVAQKV